MFANELRCAVEAAPRIKLPEIARLMWQAFALGQITETEAEELSSRIEIRKVVPRQHAPSKAVGSTARTDESLERRRRWAASGRLPPVLAAKFTMGEVAVLAVLAETVIRYGDCRRCIEQIAAIAGVCRSTVKNAVRQAETLGLVSVERRPQTAWRNLPNIVRIIAPEWQTWNRLTRRSPPRGRGVKSLTSSNTKNTKQCEKRGFEQKRRRQRRPSLAPEKSSDGNPQDRQDSQDVCTSHRARRSSKRAL